MFEFCSYIPTKVVFGPGKLKELASMKLPGKKALICVTEDGLMEKLGIQGRVLQYLSQNQIESVVYDKVTPNPTRKGVMEAAELAKTENCDFFIGLGGGSSIDTAKAASIMMVNEGDLWDYAQAGTGGRKEVKGAFPVMTITTTAGTGTECDPWCVITNEQTKEKLDFGTDAVFPVISVIDPELMLTLPRTLTLYQGFDALFHAVECYIATCGCKLTDIYCLEAVKLITRWLPVVAEDGENLEARVNISYAANVLCGFAQSLSATISPHIIGQCMSGLFPGFVHGASLIVTAEAYYKLVIDRGYVSDKFQELGRAMGEEQEEGRPGSSFLSGLTKLMAQTEMRDLPMSQFGVRKEDIKRIAEISTGKGFDFDPYVLTKEDVEEILEKSYR